MLLDNMDSGQESPIVPDQSDFLTLKKMLFKNWTRTISFWLPNESDLNGASTAWWFPCAGQGCRLANRPACLTGRSRQNPARWPAHSICLWWGMESLCDRTETRMARREGRAKFRQNLLDPRPSSGLEKVSHSNLCKSNCDGTARGHLKREEVKIKLKKLSNQQSKFSCYYCVVLGLLYVIPSPR